MIDAEADSLGEPTDEVVHDLCCYLAEAGMVGQAAVLARRFLSERSDQPWACVLLGKCLSQLGQHEAALEAFWRAIDHNPNLIDARYNAGLCAKLLGDHEQALGHFREVILLNHKDERVYNLMGECCTAMGLREQAALFFAQARRLAPDFQAPIDNLRALWEGAHGPVHLGAPDRAPDDPRRRPPREAREDAP